MQGFPSLQLIAVPDLQTPPTQVSPVVHAFPSLQGFVFAVFTHPVVALHVSFVHTLPSSQFAGVPLQVPDWQVSLWVHAFPSSQPVPLIGG